jgi:hypothetical protein
MIVKDHEKKASGFISVTQSLRVPTSARCGGHGGVAPVSAGAPSRGRAAARMPLRVFRWSWWNVPLVTVEEDVGGRHGGANDA